MLDELEKHKLLYKDKFTAVEIEAFKEGERGIRGDALALLFNDHLDLVEKYNKMVDVVNELKAKDNLENGIDDLLSKVKSPVGN